MLNFLTPPQFQDPETNRKASFLYKIVWAVLIIITVTFTIVPLNEPKYTFRSVCIIGLTWLGSSIILFLLKKGQIRTTTIMYVFFVLLMIFGFAWIGGGIKAHGIKILPIVVLFAGITLGRKEIWIFGLIAVAGSLGLVIADYYNLLAVSEPAGKTPILYWVFSTTSIMLMCWFESISVNGLNTALNEAKQELALRKISEKKVAELFNLTYGFIGLLKPDGTLEEANQSALNFIGANLAEVKGKLFWDTPWWSHSPETQNQIRWAVQEAAKGNLIRFETVHPSKNGSLHTFDFTLKPIKDESGKVIMLIPEGHNITERKKAEEELYHSQQKLSIAFSSNPNVIFISDQETGHIIEVNNSIKNIYGYSREEALGKTTLELDIYKTPEERRKVLKKIQESGHVQNLEIIGKHKSGSELNLLISVEQSDIDGKPCFVTIIYDITEHKKAQEKLRESEERYKSIITVSNTGAWEYHRDTGYLWCSPEYFSMLGRNQSDYDMSGNKNLKETWIDLIHPDDREASANHFAEYLKNGPVEMYESYFRMKHFDGSWIWIWSRGKTLRDVNGNVTNVTVGTHIDITERKRAEELLKLQNKKLFEIAFLQSHVVRRPIANVLGLIDLINFDDPNDPQNLELIPNLKVAAKELDTVIHQIVEKTGEIESFSKQGTDDPDSE